MFALQTGVNDRTENCSVLSISRIEEFYHRAIGCADELRNRRSPRKYAAIKNVIYMSARSLSIIAVEGNFPDCDFTNKQLFALGVFIRKINSIFILKGRSSEKKLQRDFLRPLLGAKTLLYPLMENLLRQSIMIATKQLLQIISIAIFLMDIRLLQTRKQVLAMLRSQLISLLR